MVDCSIINFVENSLPKLGKTKILLGHIYRDHVSLYPLPIGLELKPYRFNKRIEI